MLTASIRSYVFVNEMNISNAIKAINLIMLTSGLHTKRTGEPT